MTTYSPSTTIFFLPERQRWLARALTELRSYTASMGLILPTRLAVRVGRPQVIEGLPARGECWSAVSAPEGMPTIVISDLLTDPVEILGVLLHELIHSVDEQNTGHGDWFKSWSEHLGLVGLTSTTVGQKLYPRLKQLADSLGAYPESNIGYKVAATGSLVL